MAVGGSVKFRTCKRCGGEYPEIFFASTGNSGGTRSSTWRRQICLGCKQLEKDDHKQRNRPNAKARNTFYNHADKFIKQGLAESRKDFALCYGWHVDQMAHDIEHAYKNGCPYCRQSFAEMAHGLADLTLDIIDPEKLPYYSTNVKWVCATCNKEKQRTPPEHWGAKLVSWDLWRRQQKALEDDPWAGTLFEGVEFSVQQHLTR